VFIRARHLHRKWVKAGGLCWQMQGHMISLFIGALALSLPATLAWFMQMYFWIRAVRESTFCANHYSYMVSYHTMLIVGMGALRPLCFALFLIAKSLVLIRLVEITAPGSKSTRCVRIAVIVSVVASNLVTLVAAVLFGWQDVYYLRAYQDAQSVIRQLDKENCIDAMGHLNVSSVVCQTTLIRDVYPTLNELNQKQHDSSIYATLHYGSQARRALALRACCRVTPCPVAGVLTAVGHWLVRLGRHSQPIVRFVTQQ